MSNQSNDLVAERDALRAEVERLRQEITDERHQYERWMNERRLRAEKAEAALAEERAKAGDLAAALGLILHDAHPVYGSTAGWRGGIGGQAMTQGCSIIDPPSDADWTQYDMPSEPLREWLNGRDFDLNAAKERLKAKWSAALADPAETPTEGKP